MRNYALSQIATICHIGGIHNIKFDLNQNIVSEDLFERDAKIPSYNYIFYYKRDVLSYSRILRAGTKPLVLSMRGATDLLTTVRKAREEAGFTFDHPGEVQMREPTPFPQLSHLKGYLGSCLLLP